MFDEPLESSTWTPIKSSKHLWDIQCRPLLRVFRNSTSKVRSIFRTFDVDHCYACSNQYIKSLKLLWKVRCEPLLLFYNSTLNVRNHTPSIRLYLKSNFNILSTSFGLVSSKLVCINHHRDPQMPPHFHASLLSYFLSVRERERDFRGRKGDFCVAQLHSRKTLNSKLFFMMLAS